MSGEFLSIFLHVLLQGLIYSFVVLGLYFSSRVIKFDDLTTEGGFGIGGALSAVLIFSGVSPWVALAVAMAGGALAGAVTGLLHTKMKMNNLISGLVVTTALFSICLKLATSNLSLPDERSIFPSKPLLTLALLAGMAAAAFLGMRRLLRSELGLLFIAAGSSPQIVTSLGRCVDNYKIAGLAIANSLTALAGALFVQWSGFFSITGNIGTLVIGMAGLILAEMISPKFGLSLVWGALLYQALFAITIECEVQPMWNNLIKAALIVLLIQCKPRQEALQR